MLFKRKNGGVVEAKNNYEASILMSNKDYTPFENKENAQPVVINEKKPEENAQKNKNIVQKASKKKDGE